MDDGSFDSYAPASSGYSREDFYTRATDHRGHLKSWRHGPKNDVLSVPPELHAMLAALRERFSEYTSNADIMRDALIHLCHMREEQLSSPSPKISRSVAQTFAMARLEALIAEKERQEKTILYAESLFQVHQGDVQARMETVNVVRDLAEQEANVAFKQRLEDLIRRYS